MTVIVASGGAGLGYNHPMRTSIESNADFMINDTFTIGVSNGTGFLRFAVIKLKQGQSVTCVNNTLADSGGAVAIYAI